jgi:hypothetical protein
VTFTVISLAELVLIPEFWSREKLVCIMEFGMIVKSSVMTKVATLLTNPLL